MVAVDVYENIDEKQELYIKQLQEYLTYTNSNEKDKYQYLVKNSKVKFMQVGHVTLSHPVKSFVEGPIPRNSFHSTLAVRLVIPLERFRN